MKTLKILLAALSLLGTVPLSAQAQTPTTAETPVAPNTDKNGITAGRDGSTGTELRPVDPAGTTPGVSAGGETIRDGAPPLGVRPNIGRVKPEVRTPDSAPRDATAAPVKPDAAAHGS